jgi:7-carboxy-7-deazaguanine synthase
MREEQLLIHEIFHSIQGESTWVGLPCVFVRLRGCPLRCHYCDTSYAFHEGQKLSIESIIQEVQRYSTKLVEITGGEPLLQSNVYSLMNALLEEGYEVLLETSGERDLSTCDSRIFRVIDIKTPCSGAADSFIQSNYDQLTLKDEVKFVITNREDFDWAVETVRQNNLLGKVRAVHFSPVMEQEGNSCIQGAKQLEPAILSEWILSSGMPIRMHIQLHKYIWAPQLRGV